MHGSTNLPTFAWLLIGVVATVMAFKCLDMLGRYVNYHLTFNRVVREARRLRQEKFGDVEHRPGLTDDLDKLILQAQAAKKESKSQDPRKAA